MLFTRESYESKKFVSWRDLPFLRVGLVDSLFYLKSTFSVKQNNVTI